MSDQKHWVTISLAIIGLVGSIGAAALSNWDKIFGDPTAISSTNIKNIKPSFDCARASNAAEQMVCSSSELAILDLSISNSYRDAMASLRAPHERRQLKDAQLYWLKEVRNRCSSIECMKNAYDTRLQDLK